MRGQVAGGRGVAVAQAARRVDPTVEAAGRARAERTPNMPDMIVTLDVLRLSGWLNAVADCRVQSEAYHESDMEGQETGAEGVGAAA